MKPTEAAALLTIAAAFDNRKPDADQAKAWALALHRERFEDCRDAIVEHYRASREWLMPNEVVAGVRRLRERRLSEYGPIPAPAYIDPDDAAALRRYIADMQRQIADGTITAPPEIEWDGPTHDVVAELGHVGHAMPRTDYAAARADLVRTAGGLETEQGETEESDHE